MASHRICKLPLATSALRVQMHFLLSQPERWPFFSRRVRHRSDELDRSPSHSFSRPAQTPRTLRSSLPAGLLGSDSSTGSMLLVDEGLIWSQRSAASIFGETWLQWHMGPGLRPEALPHDEDLVNHGAAFSHRKPSCSGKCQAAESCWDCGPFRAPRQEADLVRTGFLWDSDLGARFKPCSCRMRISDHPGASSRPGDQQPSSLRDVHMTLCHGRDLDCRDAEDSARLRTEK